MKWGEIFKTVFLLLGAIIGAGFASGKEIFLFFGSFSLTSLAVIVFAGVMFFLFCFLFLRAGASKRYIKFQKSKVYLVFDFIIVFFIAITASVMMAGFQDAFGFVATFISILFAIYMATSGVKILKIASVVIVPILIFGISYICVKSILIESINVIYYPTMPYLKAGLYIGMNIFLATEVLTADGKNLNKKEALFASLIASIMLVIMMILSVLAFKAFGVNGSEAMPMLDMARAVGRVEYYLFMLVLWCGIFTTLASSLFSLKQKVVVKLKLNDSFLVLISIFCYALSVLGFEKIVDIFYPLEGYVGLIYVAVIYVFVFALPVFQAKQQQSTLGRQGSIKSRLKP